MVPATHAINRHFAPHRPAIHKVATPAAMAARSDCLPGVVLASGGNLVPMAPLVLDDGSTVAAPVQSADGFPFGPAASVGHLTPTSAGGSGGGGGYYDGGSGGGGYSGGGGGGGGGGSTGGQPGGGTPVNPPSALPEPASWALMVIGFGTLGGALRASRRPSVSKGDVVEVKLG